MKSNKVCVDKRLSFLTIGVILVVGFILFVSLIGKTKPSSNARATNITDKSTVTSSQLLPTLVKVRGVKVKVDGRDVNLEVHINGLTDNPHAKLETIYDKVDKHTLANKIKTSIPSSVDLSTQTKFFPPIGYQGNQGSCAAWAVAYYKTFQENRERWWRGEETDSAIYDEYRFTPAFLYNQWHACDGSDCSNCLLGSSEDQLMDKLQEYGILSWARWPYNYLDCTSQPAEHDSDWEGHAAPYKSLSHSLMYGAQGTVNDDMLTILKGHINSGDIFTTGLLVGNELINAKCSAVTRDPDTYPTSPWGSHAVTVVGYDDNYSGTGIGAFKIANSWSTAWGCQGFGWVSYDYFKEFAYIGFKMTDKAYIQSPTLAITTYPPSPTWGGSLTYTFTTTSSIPVDAVRLTVNLTNATAIDAGCPTCISGGGTTVNWELSDTVGTTTTKTLTVTLPPDQGQSLDVVAHAVTSNHQPPESGIDDSPRSPDRVADLTVHLVSVPTPTPTPIPSTSKTIYLPLIRH